MPNPNLPAGNLTWGEMLALSVLYALFWTAWLWRM